MSGTTRFDSLVGLVLGAGFLDSLTIGAFTSDGVTVSSLAATIHAPVAVNPHVAYRISAVSDADATVTIQGYQAVNNTIVPVSSVIYTVVGYANGALLVTTSANSLATLLANNDTSALFALSLSGLSIGANLVFGPVGSAQVGIGTQGFGHALFAVPFDNATLQAAAQPLLDSINTGLHSGALIGTAYGQTATVPSGHTGVLQIGTAVQTSVPDGYGAVLDDANGRVTLFGGIADNESVVAGNGGILFIPTLGSGTLVAGGGNNEFYEQPASDPNWNIVFGAGNDTVVVQYSSDTINAGTGANLIYLNNGACVVTSLGTDTVVGGTAAATVASPTGTTFLWSPSADLVFTGGSGTSTIVGSVSGHATVTGGSGRLLDLAQGPTTYVGAGGADTVAAFHGAIVATGGSGNSLFLGGPDGANSITGGGGSNTIFGGGGGGMLRATGSSSTYIVGQAGSSTLSAVGTSGTEFFYGGTGDAVFIGGDGVMLVNAGTGAETVIGGAGRSDSGGAGNELIGFFQGRGTQMVVQDFDPGRDFIALRGFASTEPTTAVGAANVSGGNTIVHLSDGSHITFVGFTGLTAASLSA